MSVRAHEGKPYVAMRLKSIKQDGLIERPEAMGNEDWIILGDAEGEFSIITWIKALFAHHKGARDPHSAFFMDRDKKRWLTYANAMRDVRALWERASSRETAMQYGLHSLRVSGYNAAKRGKHGTALAVAHGGWMSTAHERYDRFSLSDVIALSGVIASSESDADTSSVAVLQRAPAVDVSSPADVIERPRPDRIRTGTGSARGFKRRDVSSQQACVRHAATTAPPLAKSDHIQVWWSGERKWFSARVKAIGKGEVCTVVYDDDHATLVHDLALERWRRI